MTQSPLNTPALSTAEVRALSRALSAGDVTVFVDGTALRLPTAARDAVLDLLARLGRGEGVSVSSLTAGAGPSGAGPAAAGLQATPPQATAAAATRPEGPGFPLLTTSQAAAAAGISHTYLRNLTDAGIIPVQYRGTHRRIRLADVEAWLEQQAAKGPRAGEAPAPGES